MGFASSFLTGSRTVGILFSLSIKTGKEWYDSRPNGSGWSGAGKILRGMPPVLPAALPCGI